ncbi:hypothetical protein Vse01_36350 [Micromonospora sediminimaris]|uniref:Uncharacterized protein n=1 Tax=Micromonospora sediminimaris TaxID=547162 RepID=A0A9W5XKZ2_9ACTN|nr:hypothetical protein Vse01_36350 [Micromonospora sediminimaris]
MGGVQFWERGSPRLQESSLLQFAKRAENPFEECCTSELVVALEVRLQVDEGVKNIVARTFAVVAALVAYGDVF